MGKLLACLFVKQTNSAVAYNQGNNAQGADQDQGQ